MDVLREILDAKAREVERLRPRRAELEAAAAAAPPVRGFARAVSAGPHVAVIAEHKRRAPSAGHLAPGSRAGPACARYARAGAAALSVLTDADRFGGSLEDLREARAACDLPVLRKDFIVDAVQVSEARAAGADAILLIARAIPGALLLELRGAAREAGMDALVEVHDEAELERALAAGSSLVGINSRDLSTFETDLTRIARLAGSVPERVTLVGESGIAGADDVRLLGDAGVHAVLVGSFLMTSADPAAALRELVGHPRRARSGAEAGARSR